MAEPMMKGSAIRELLLWYESRYGKDRVRLMAQRAPDDLKELLDPDEPAVTILASSWYPARLVHSMLDTATDGMTRGEIERFAREAGVASTASGLRRIYRF